MRDVEYGWLIRYMHSTGASAFFAVVYLHMFRGLLYGSYRKPRELVWIFGMAIYLMLMAEGFLGYVLPWGQMSYWGAQVIISLFGAIPYFGEDIVQWIRGDYLISGITLNRFFALHVVAVPIILLALVLMHILALHEVGSNNPDGVEIKKKKGARRRSARRRRLPSVLHRARPVGIAVFLFVFCCDHLLHAGNGRLLPRARQLRGSQLAEDPAAHRAGVVLHAVLLDAARGAGQVRRIHGDGGGGRDTCSCCLGSTAARSSPSVTRAR